MKKCALAPALVLAFSTVTWGSLCTGIEVTQACPLNTISIGITTSLHCGVHSWVVHHVTHMSGISIGCHNTGTPHCWPVPNWPCPGHHGNNSNNATTANSSTSTMASGPAGDAVADSSSSSTSTSGHGSSSSSSTSHSQSIVQ